MVAGLDAASPTEIAPSLDQRLRSDLADAKLESFTLLEGALISGGVDSDDHLAALKQRFAEACQRVTMDHRELNDPRAKADQVVLQLHEHLLTGTYRADCSALGETLETGDYNCVTASILFQCLAEKCGLTAHGVSARGHVLCSVDATPPLFVEPTCRHWRTCEAAACPEPTAKFVRECRELSNEQLLGKVYYNLGVARLEQSEFERAADLLRIAARLDQDDPAARANVLATFNNWALAKCDGGHLAEAAELLHQGLATDPNYAPLRANDLHIHQKWIKRLCAQRRYDEALVVLDGGYQRRPDAELFARGRLAVKELMRQQQTVATDVQTSEVSETSEVYSANRIDICPLPIPELDIGSP